MTLNIDTTQNQSIKISLKYNGKIIVEKKFNSRYTQAEKLLPAIEKTLAKTHLNLRDIEKIEVANGGGSFTALRIGVVTANALAYALGIPVDSGGKDKLINQGLGDKFFVVEPEYSGEPVITKKKNN